MALACCLTPFRCLSMGDVRGGAGDGRRVDVNRLTLALRRAPLSGRGERGGICLSRMPHAGEVKYGPLRGVQEGGMPARGFCVAPPQRLPPISEAFRQAEGYQDTTLPDKTASSTPGGTPAPRGGDRMCRSGRTKGRNRRGDPLFSEIEPRPPAQGGPANEISPSPPPHRFRHTRSSSYRRSRTS